MDCSNLYDLLKLHPKTRNKERNNDNDNKNNNWIIYQSFYLLVQHYFTLFLLLQVIKFLDTNALVPNFFYIVIEK
jgi:hypothetical protein